MAQLNMPFWITNPDTTRFAEGSVEGLNGMAGLGFFRLLINLKLHVDGASSPSRLSQLTGELMVGNRQAVRLHASSQNLPLAQYPEAVTVSVVLEGDLDRARLEAIEEVRGGGHLPVMLLVHTELIDAAGQTRRSQLQEQWQVNQGVWVGVLEQMQYRRTMLLEIPVPDAQTHPELAQAAGLLGRAQQALMRGDYRDAVGLCREVVEEMSKALGDTAAAPLPELFAGQRQMSKADRLRVLRQALKLFTHPAHHRDSVSVGMEWSRVDAASTVTIAAALLNELTAPGARPE